MRTSSRAAALFLAAVLASPAYAVALPPDPAEVVPGHPGVIYVELLKQIMPDLVKDKDGHWTSLNLPRLLDLDGAPLEASDITFDGIETLVVKDGGKKRILVLTGQNMGNSFSAILAVFDDAPKVPKLLDLRDVGRDRFSDFSGALLPLSRDTDAFTIQASHNSSDESFVIDTILFVDDGKIRVATSLGTFALGMCAYRLTEEPIYATRPDPGHAFNAIVVKAHQVVTHTGEECDQPDVKVPKAQNQTFTDIFHWDDKKKVFIAKTHALSGLIGESP